MIKKYSIRLTPQNDERIDSGAAYRLYAALLEQLPFDYAQCLHESEITPVAQYVIFERNTGEHLWNIALFGDEACRLFSDVLENRTNIDMERGRMEYSVREVSEYPDMKSLLETATGLPDSSIWNMTFLTPTTFKSGGEYALFPSSELIVKSMISRMDALCDEAAVNDADAMRMLIEGIKISGYRLNSTGFFMKGQRIPAFIGSVRLHIRLSAPMFELWKLLVTFAELSGVGVKPALGMGGICFRGE